ncbi:MAG TPA: homocitrate synthase [Pirellulaceae bacterium]|nr:homocitrate synthase [Pirellulaceae bacterium]HMO94098.1 homocitrate synthase [Pirellulaceae bacterium]HMP71025.1 homocitrate synthase [Pirellulaceae bacterium]
MHQIQKLDGATDDSIIQSNEDRLRRFGIIDSTLREGEQFANAFFSTDDKIEIATILDAFGVEYLELTSPCASPQSEHDCRAIAGLGLKSKILTHIRCNLDDARRAVATGVDGVDVVIGTSSLLREFGHGKSTAQIIDLAVEVISWLRQQKIEVRFSTEDSLRSELDDLIAVYQAVDRLGVDRVGIADTVGIGSPHQIGELVRAVAANVSADIEFHGHNDTGCAIANAYAALLAGARYIDTSVLGIGERNGITPLGGLIARLYAHSADLVRKYRLDLLHEIDHLVAEMVGVDVPFNNYITGFAAFTHKAGIHAKAVLNNPSTYEILDPSDFGLTRYIHVAHRLTGWNAIRSRVDQLKLTLSDEQVKAITSQIKQMADSGKLTLDDVDAVIYAHSRHAQSNESIEHFENHLASCPEITDHQPVALEERQ